MLDRHRLLRHGQGWALLFVLVFVTLSLVGYDPADPPGRAAWPGNETPANPCGPVGAVLAHGLVASLGGAAFWLVLVLGGLVLRVFRRRPVSEPLVRAGGLALVLVVTSALVQVFQPDLPPSAPVGGGGYVGALIAALLAGQFGPIGMMLILTGAGLVGLALCLEELVLWPLRELVGWLRGSRRGVGYGVGPTLVPVGPCEPPPRGVTPGNPHRPAVVEQPGAPAATPARSPTPADLWGPVATPSSPSPPPSRGSAGVPAPTAPHSPRALDQYQLPPLDLLDPPSPFPILEHEAEIHGRAFLLERTLAEHNCHVRVVQIDTGPVITQYEIELEAGLRVSRITSLANDLARALAVQSVRIVAPIPGKTTVGVEVPNERREIVKLGEVVDGVGSHLRKYRIPLFLGKDVKGSPLAYDLADMPHLLIAGRTGTGKSVCLNAMILSILMTRRPDEVKLILIDPKMVELSQFKRIPHLMHPVVTDMKKAEALLAWACDKMDERYGYLARAGVRNIQTYNLLGAQEIYARLNPEDEEERARIPTYMPYIVIIADEMADLMMTAAKEVEAHIVRLAQKARAVGMHLIVATQKPTVDVVTGLIKGNLPARIAFQVASRNDSRVVLDEMGADKLLGNGDMLFLIPGTSHIIRAQGTYVSDAEVTRICEFLQQYPIEFSRELVQLQVGGGLGGKDRGASLKERDELYEAAIEIIIREGRGSCSLLQRALGIGYGRAARLIDFMAEDGIVGEYKSGAAREVLYTWEEWEALKNGDEPAEPVA